MQHARYVVNVSVYQLAVNLRRGQTSRQKEEKVSNHSAHFFA
jgi:hypothetical protein